MKIKSLGLSKGHFQTIFNIQVDTNERILLHIPFKYFIIDFKQDIYFKLVNQQQFKKNYLVMGNKTYQLPKQ